MIKDAIIDPTGTYRYSLWRIWDHSLPKVVFVMLNPSTADHKEDDPTIRRCIGFSKDWGFGSLEVINLFAFRATNPYELKKCADPIGPENDAYIRKALENRPRVIAAWGTKGGIDGRDRQVAKMLQPHLPLCLGTSKDGHPKHPLYIAANYEPTRFRWSIA